MTSPASQDPTGREEWEDTDFDIPDGHQLFQTNLASDAEDGDPEDNADLDWDAEMSLAPLTTAKGVSAQPHTSSASVPDRGALAGHSGTITRLGASKKVAKEDWDDVKVPAAPMPQHTRQNQSTLLPSQSSQIQYDSTDTELDWDLEGEEGASTIKLPPGQPILPATLTITSPTPVSNTPVAPVTPSRQQDAESVVTQKNLEIDDDFESDFALPTDLNKLALRPLRHQASYGTLASYGDGWGDHTASSSTTYSSEASSLGLHHPSPSSASTSPFSRTGVETDEDDDGFLEGLVVPDGLFEKSAKRDLTKLLEDKKSAPQPRLKQMSNPAYIDDDDFLDGLMLDDSFQILPSKGSKHGSYATAVLSSNRSDRNDSSPSPLTRSATDSPTKPRSSSRTSTTSTSSRNRSPPSVSGLGRSSPASVSTAETRKSAPTQISKAPPPSSFNAARISGSVPGTAFGGLRHKKSSGGIAPAPGAATRRIVAKKTSMPSLKNVPGSSGFSSDGGSAGGFPTTKAISAPRTQLDARRPVVAASHLASQVPSSPGSTGPIIGARYNTSTAASRAKVSTGLNSLTTANAAHGSGENIALMLPDVAKWIVPPTRPSTPSKNPTVLRLSVGVGRAPVNRIFSDQTVLLGGPNTSASQTFANAAKAPVSAQAPAQRRQTFHGVGNASPKPLRFSRLSTLAISSSVVPQPTGSKVLKRPKRSRVGGWGDGTELDGIEDLEVDSAKEKSFVKEIKGWSLGGRVTTIKPGISGISIASKPNPAASGARTLTRKHRIDLSQYRESDGEGPKRKDRSPGGSTLVVPKASAGPKKRKTSGSKQKPTLIRNLSGAQSPKVVGDMRYDPVTQRWEGNEQDMREFDAMISSSARPALITHLTGSSIGSPVMGGGGYGARVVGDMVFDPTKMCWLNRFGNEFEEDVFADIDADDESAVDDWDGARGGTIRASIGSLGLVRSSSPSSQGSMTTPVPDSAASDLNFAINRPSPGPGSATSQTYHSRIHNLSAPAHAASLSETESSSERGSRMYSADEQERLRAAVAAGAKDAEVWDVSEAFIKECEAASERHKDEVHGWILPVSRRAGRASSGLRGTPVHGMEERIDRDWLNDIRTLATKKYPQ